MDKASKTLIVFTVIPLGFYNSAQVQFGLTNAPWMFQILMQSCLGKLQINWCLIYLNVIILYSKMLKDHLIHLRVVLQRLKDAIWKLKLTKHEFFQECINAFRHYISEKGITTDCHKMQVIRDWPVPKTVTGICSCLVFMNYYHCFIHRNA